MAKSSLAGRLRAAVPALVAAAVVLVFWTCVRNGFINSDDPEFMIRPFRGLSFADVKGVFTTFYFSNYVPLSLLSLSADFALWA